MRRHAEDDDLPSGSSRSSLPLSPSDAPRKASKRAEEGLRRKGRYYRGLIENSVDIITVFDTGGTILYASPSIQRILGYEPHDVIGKQALSFVHPDDLADVSNALALSFQDPIPDASIEYRVRHRDGSWRFAQSLNDILTDESGETLVVVSTRDVTERKRAEEALRESEERYRALFEAAFEGIVIHENGIMLDANPAFERMFGYSLSELVGRAGYDLLVEESREPVRQKFESGTETYQAVGLRKDGTTFDIEVIAKAHTYKGRPVRVVAVRDVTERKRAEEALRESEERYRALFEQAADSVVLIDGETGALVQFNDRAHATLGYTREEFEKLKVPDIDAIQSPEEIAKHREKIIKEGVDTFETKHRGKDGEIRDIQVSARTLSLGGRNLIQCILRDITEQKQVEETLRRQEQEIRVIADNVPALFSYIDADGYYRFVNKRYEEWFGMPRTEIIGRHYRDVLGEATDDVIRDRVETALTGHPVSYEEALPYAHGGTRWVSAEYVPDIDESGKVKGFYALVTDITERKEMEQALEEALEKAREGIEDRIERRLRRRNVYGLTFRELTVLQMVAAGQSDRDIGIALGTTHLTAQKHVSNILRKMEAASRTEAAVRGLREGLID